MKSKTQVIEAICPKCRSLSFRVIWLPLIQCLGCGCRYRYQEPVSRIPRQAQGKAV